MIPTRKGEPERGAFKLAVMDVLQSAEKRDLPMPEIISWSRDVVRCTWPSFEPEFDAALLDV